MERLQARRSRESRRGYKPLPQMRMHDRFQPLDDVTLGLLAGGAGSRLGGVDKAWLRRGGVPQVLRLAKRLSGETASVLVSANRDLQRYAEAGLTAIPDRLADIGGGRHRIAGPRDAGPDRRCPA